MKVSVPFKHKHKLLTSIRVVCFEIYIFPCREYMFIHKTEFIICRNIQLQVHQFKNYPEVIILFL